MLKLVKQPAGQKRRWALFLGIAGLSLSLSLHAQTTRSSERNRFLLELNAAFLETADGTPLSLGPGEGWRGIVLAPPGTPLSASATPFDGIGHDSINVSKLLEAAVMNNARPLPPAPALPVDNGPEKLLFRQRDAIDTARGIDFLREPSQPFLRYREYEALLRMLNISEARRDETWRLHPRLAPYASLEDAKAAIINDWLQLGYKAEIDRALAQYDDQTGSPDWRVWTKADSLVSTYQIALDVYASVPVTFLSPPASEWFGMPNWMNGISSTIINGQSVRVRFQIAFVDIVRPWLDIEPLQQRKIHVHGPLARAISDGRPPDAVTYPKGFMAEYPEKLVLVRNIRFTQGEGSLETRIDNPNAAQPFGIISIHPLGIFSYRDETNLLGYVVRALPGIVPSKAP